MGIGKCSTLNSVTLPISVKFIMLVPVIAILTKYEAFIDRAKSTVKERQGHEPNKKQILAYLDEQVLVNIKRTDYLPAAIVQTHHKHCSRMKVGRKEAILISLNRQGGGV